MVKREIKHILKSSQGFTLMEVMIAITIFTVFSTAFVTGMGYNLLDSGKLKEDILLKDLCENKISELIINPPTFNDALTLTKETKEIENFDDYQTIVEYKKFFVPDMSKIQPSTAQDVSSQLDEEISKDSNMNALEQKIFKTVKDNMEKILWQVQVTVKNKLTGETYTLSSWLYNRGAQVKIDAL